MKLTLLTPALVAIVGLAFAGPTFAQAATTSTPATTTEPGTPTTVPAKAKKIPYRGTLSAIDTGTNTITVKSSVKTLTLTISPETTYKGAADLSGFAVGDAVTGSYMKDAAGTMTACSLHKKTAPAPKQ